MPSFKAKIAIIGINPYVSLPASALQQIFKAAGKSSGPIPVCGSIEATPYTQNLVRYQGAWRLYLNTPMRRGAGKEVGDLARVTVDFDPAPRVTPMPPALRKALALDKGVKAAFEALAPSRRKEIQRYLNQLKRPVTVARNIRYVMDYLQGKPPQGMKPLLRIQGKR
jgi:Bacteriocin-protection, YdeI or OmpD-Associated/Domain of unknown function (DUF1905)